ncbi:hypothetical protein ACU4GD_23240 (plasmid) [Cupriavidus basilensis]
MKVNVVRYADDFVITGNTPDVLEHEGEAVGRAVPSSTGADAIDGENADRPHCRRLRLPWVEFPEVLENAAHQPSRKNVQTFYRKVKG